MQVNVKASVPLWLHLAATTLSGFVWLGISVANALVPELRAMPLDPSFPEMTTTALGATLLPRFSEQAPPDSVG